MTCQKLIRRLSTVQVLTSYFFNLSITVINDNDLVHVEHIPFYLPHQKKKVWTSSYIHHEITCTTENDKQTEISTGKDTWAEAQTPGVFLSYSETKEMPIGTKRAPNIPLKGSKYWTKTLQAVNQMPLGAKNVEKESEPLAAGSCKNASGEGLSCMCLLQTLCMYWPLSAEMGCWIRQA